MSVCRTSTTLLGFGLACCPGFATALDFENFSIHGFVSQGYMISTENNWLPGSTDGTFEFNEIGLNIGTQVTDRLRVGLQLFSRDFGDLGNNEIELDWAYGDYTINDYVGVRAGRFKTPQAIYNEYVDLDIARIPTLYPDSVYSAAFRDISVATNGVTLYGNLPMGPAGSVDFDLWTGDLRIDPEGSFGKIFGGAITPVSETDVKYVHGARLLWNTPLDGLRAGLTYVFYDDLTASGPSPVPSPVPSLPAGDAVFLFPNLYQYTVSLEYTWEDWVFSGEYARMRDTYSYQINEVIGSVEGRLEREGFYLMASYQATDKLGIAAYFSTFYPDANDRDGDDSAIDHTAWARVYSLSARYDVLDSWSLKGEIQIRDGTAELFASENPDGLEEDWQVFLLKSTFLF